MTEAMDSTRFPEGKKRREKRKAVIRESNELREHIPSYFKRYAWVDSDLDSDGDGAPASFWRTFKNVLPPETHSLKRYIEDLLQSKKGEAIFAEFGGIGSSVADSFSKGFFKRSFGIDVVDPGDNHGYWFMGRKRHKEAERGHEVMEGNLLTPDIYEELRKRLNGQKLDLIIERMGRGLEFSPEDTRTIGALLRVWYELLNDDGIMFLQIPVHFNPIIPAWAEHVVKEAGDSLELRYSLGKKDSGYFSDEVSVLYLRKKAGAPAQLPLLDVSGVKSAEFWHTKGF